MGLWALPRRQFQGLQLEREACLASNYALAKENLALRPRLEMGRTALAIKYQELREVAESCADKLQRLGEGRPGELPRERWGGGGASVPGSEGWGTWAHLFFGKVCRGATPGQFPSWESERLVSRAELERPEWGPGRRGDPLPKGLGCSGRQSPCFLFCTRMGGGWAHKLMPRGVVQVRKLRLQRGEGKRRVTHTVRERVGSGPWGSGLSVQGDRP